MLTDGIQLLGSSTASNFTVESGNTLPTVGNSTSGELFYKIGVGLHVFDGSTWVQVGAGATVNSASIIAALGYTPAALDSSSKILAAQLPAIAITDTFVVASQAAMLALTAETGDVVVRTDQSKSYILKGASPATLSNWQELLVPTQAVQSVNGLTGAVTLTTASVSENTNLYYTDARARAAISVTGSGGSYNSSTGVITLTGGGSSAASALTGTALASNVISSSLTSVGTLASLSVATSGTLSNNTASLVITIDKGSNTSVNQGIMMMPSTQLATSADFGPAIAWARDNTSTNKAIAAISAFRADGGFGGFLAFRTQDISGNNEPTTRFTIGQYGSFGVGNGGTSFGTTGQVLTSNGNAAPPTWASAPSPTFLTATGAYPLSTANAGTAGVYAGTTTGASGSSGLGFVSKAAATNNKYWAFDALDSSGSLTIHTLTDTGQSPVTAMQFDRSGTATTLITLTTAGLNLAIGTGGLQLNGAAGTAGQVLTSNGASAAPTWTTVSGGSGSGTVTSIALSSTDLTVTGSPITTSGTLVANLATVNSNVGSFGSASLVPVLTVDAKGRITAVSTVGVTTGSVSVLNGTSTTSETSATGIYAGRDTALVPQIIINNGTATAGAHASRIYTNSGGDIKWDLLGDTFASQANFFAVTRSGATTTNITLTGTAITLAGGVTGTSFTGTGTGLTALNATNLTSGTVGTARLGTGTANTTTYLRGDGTWATPAGGGGSITGGVANQIPYQSAANTTTFSGTLSSAGPSLITSDTAGNYAGGALTLAAGAGTTVGTVVNLLTLVNNRGGAGGAASAGDGTGISFMYASTANNSYERASIRMVIETSTNGALTFNTGLGNVGAGLYGTGTQAERFRITGTGALSIGSTGTNYGTTGQVLTSAGNAAPTWSSSVPSITGGTANQIPYQTAANTTGFSGSLATASANVLFASDTAGNSGGGALTIGSSNAGVANVLTLVNTRGSGLSEGVGVSFMDGNGSNAYERASIYMTVEAAGAHGGALSFNTGLGTAGVGQYNTGTMAERMRITQSGGIAFGGAANYGTTGQFLTSQGNAPPTWTTVSSGSGTVTTVSVTAANGVSGTVATATTTPAITLSLGAITPTSVATGAVTATSLGVTNAATASTFTASVSVQAGVSLTGNTTLRVGNASSTGYLEFWNASAVREGYIGNVTNGSGTINYSATSHAFAGSITVAGRLDIKSSTEGQAALTYAATEAIDCSLGNVFTVTLTGNITSFTLTNVPATTKAYSMTLFLTQDATGSRLVNWSGFTGIKWPSGVAPTLTTTANKTDIITMTTFNGGTTWFGFTGGLNY